MCLSATAFDMTMMAHHAGMERSESMWLDLINKIPGLKIIKFWQAPTGEGIVQLAKEQD